MTTSEELTPEEIAACQRVLSALADNPQQCLVPESSTASLLQQASLLLRRVKAQRKRQARHRDGEVVEEAGIRQKRAQKKNGQFLLTDEAVCQQPHSPSLTPLSRARRCYVCKQLYDRLHPFYDLMCPDCGNDNFAHRSAMADLSGRVALVTGGRIKIGFEIVLKLLRAGASVVATSRFPFNAALRYEAEADFEQWRDRLSIHGLDLRWLAGIKSLCSEVAAEHSGLDILINNAAQTIRRPAAFYQHLLEGEMNAARLPAAARKLVASGNEHLQAAADAAHGSRLHLSAAMSQFGVLAEDTQRSDAFRPGELDGDGQQVDRRYQNSWVQEATDVSLPELVEVHLVSSLAPFVLIQQLKPLMLASAASDRYIVNVSAMEGQLNTRFKAARHPHTNMAKAGMNMITRTCAADFAEQGIYLNSVDTGWVTNEFPHEKTERMKRGGFQPPLDEVDGAARVCHPVYTGVSEGNYIFGKFLKDYRPTTW